MGSHTIADPELTAADRDKLAQLFAELPRLRELYEFRNRFKEIFDSHCSRRTAKAKLRDLLTPTPRALLESRPLIATTSGCSPCS